MPAWLVTRYADVVAMAGHPDLSCDPVHAGDTLERALGPAARARPDLRSSLLTLDPPDHTRLRAYAVAPFTPRRSEQHQGLILAAADALIDKIAPTGRADLMPDLALPLSTTVLCEAVGVPRDGHSLVRRWLDTALLPTADAASIRALNAVLTEVDDYLVTLLPHHRANPGPSLLSRLVRALDAGALTRTEATELAATVLFAGVEAPAAVIGAGLLALLQHPDLCARLRTAPRAVLDSAVEEIVRHGGPIEALTRYSTAPIDVDGLEIPAGVPVILCTGVANHDPSAFTHPDRLDIDRTPNPHLGFGHGPHRCPGASLGRLITATAIHTALRRLPELALDTPTAPRQRNSVFVHGIAELPVTFGAQP
ncbi:cytochrome P450 [Streptomyces pathocidini]|uniref:cytochrome P450 n=1 Tax=Streptomyces pathocidini TaxID=1650571 RepID=UPI0033F4588E